MSDNWFVSSPRPSVRGMGSAALVAGVDGDDDGQRGSDIGALEATNATRRH